MGGCKRDLLGKLTAIYKSRKIYDEPIIWAAHDFMHNFAVKKEHVGGFWTTNFRASKNRKSRRSRSFL